jgi:hypothetical protein
MNEAFEKCLIFSISRKRKILTTGIQLVFRGLKFESDPREIVFAFHGAGAETCPPPADRAKGSVFQRPQ